MHIQFACLSIENHPSPVHKTSPPQLVWDTNVYASILSSGFLLASTIHMLNAEKGTVVNFGQPTWNKNKEWGTDIGEWNLTMTNNLSIIICLSMEDETSYRVWIINYFNPFKIQFKLWRQRQQQKTLILNIRCKWACNNKDKTFLLDNDF